MRHVMAGEARRRRLAAKRGAGATALQLDEAWMRPLPESVAPDALDARQAEIVDLRVFVGLTARIAAPSPSGLHRRAPGARARAW